MSEEVVFNLFLSYSRADQPRVEKLVRALEARGHKVWWDSHLTGGAAFSGEIEAALKKADVVVVAWSAASIQSNWVKDEAGAGLSRNRLVPVLLDPVSPPLGFRQIHAIDLSQWNRKPDAPQMRALEAGVAAAAAGEGEAASASPAAATTGRRWPKLAAIAAGALALIAAILLGWQALKPGSAEAAPKLAVMPFEAMAKDEDAGYFAEGVAEEILDTLAQDPNLQVVGRTTAWSFRDKLDDLSLIREKLGVGRLLEGSVRKQDDRMRISVRLIDTADGSELWSQRFERSATDTFAVQDEIARIVAAKLSGKPGDTTLDTAAAPSAVPGVYEKVMMARQLIRTRQGANIKRAYALLEDAVKADPKYALAMAEYANATYLLSERGYGDVPDRQATTDALVRARAAVALDPNLSEAWAALGKAQFGSIEYDQAITSLERALELRPTNVEALNSLRMVYLYVDQNEKAAQALEKAIALDPLWTTGVVNLVYDYLLAGKVAEAKAASARFRSMSPDAAAADLVDATFEEGSDEIAAAIGLYEAVIRRDPDSTLARQQGEYANLGLFITDWPHGRMPADAVYRLLAAGQYRHVVEKSLSEPAAKWSDNATVLSLALLKLNEPEKLVRLWQAEFGSVAAYIQANPYALPSDPALLSTAMHRLGRTTEAAELDAFTRKRIISFEKGGFPIPYLWTMLLANEGNRAGALSKLEEGVRTNWAGTCIGPSWLGDYLAVVGLHKEPRAQKALAVCTARINEQRKLLGKGPMPAR